MHWRVKNKHIPTTVDEVTSVLLENRNITNPAEFFNPPHPKNYSPKELGIDQEQFDQALARLKTAAKNNEKVVVFGDYDADGVCATAVLWQSLHALGCNVTPFIPSRIEHGYGLSVRSLELVLAEHQPSLIITVDNGIVAFEAIAHANQKGCEVIVTDHHQPEKNPVGTAIFPSALAVVHSTRLCGTTVAWMLSKALTPKKAEGQLDLCAVATIADMVPLIGAGRSFAYHGIAQLRQAPSVGLQELCNSAKVEPAVVTARSIGYSLAPRINAMGRVAHGMDALRLLCTTKKTTAKKLAQVLDSTNTQRQELTAGMFEEALAQAEQMREQQILVVASELFHEGVIGLVAGRLVEQYHKPVVAVALGESVAKASARSVAGVDIVELLRLIRGELLELGGHPMAAGFSMLSANIDVVRQTLQTVAFLHISPEALEPHLAIECELSPGCVSGELLDQLEAFEPFGKGNEQPVFVLPELTILESSSIGKDKNHLKLSVLLSPEKKPVPALFWNGREKVGVINPNSKASVAATLEWNHWNGQKNLQLIVEDIRLD